MTAVEGRCYNSPVSVPYPGTPTHHPDPTRSLDAMEAQIAVAKIAKYATSESGDTVEVVERPHGGISVVVADGQRSGASAKIISNLVARKAISLLAEGVRDGAVARATHDYLRTHRRGKVSAEMSIVSVDLVTRTLVVSRNSRCPVLVRRGDEVNWLRDDSEAVGIHRNTKPAIAEMALEPSLCVAVFTDGVLQAGSRQGQAMDVAGVLNGADPDHRATAQEVADAILQAALALDSGRPRDDATVLIVKIGPRDSEDKIRRLLMRFPF